MRAIILAGGLGTRLAEETSLRPKPMVEIGGYPILWHIMNIFSQQGVDEFIIALGYKGHLIKEYFLNFYALNNDVSVDLRTGTSTIHHRNHNKWTVHLVDTGLATQTGGRLKRLQSWLKPDEEFFFTYGDGVADVDLNELARFHHLHSRLATVTTVRSPARFGRLTFEEDRVSEFHEKPELGEGWINGGFFLLNAQVINYIQDDESIWEREPIDRLVQDGQLVGYRHYGFWSCMDTLKEKQALELQWQSGKAPWKIW